MKRDGHLRGSGHSQISLFAFQDITFAATGIFLLVGVFYAILGKIEKFSIEDLNEKQSLQNQIDSVAIKKLEVLRKIEVLKSDYQKVEVPQPHVGETKNLNPWLYDLSELNYENKGLLYEMKFNQKSLLSLVKELHLMETSLDNINQSIISEIAFNDISVNLPDDKVSLRTNLFIVVHKTGIDVLNLFQPKESIHSLSVNALLSELNKYPSDQYNLHFLIKPSGIYFFNLKEKTDSLNKKTILEYIRELGYNIVYEPLQEEVNFQ